MFQIVTGRQVPVFLASSFAFITPIILAKGQFGLAATMGGVMAAGFVYTFLGLAVKNQRHRFHRPSAATGGDWSGNHLHSAWPWAPIAANMAMGKAGDGTELIHYQTGNAHLHASAADHPDRRSVSVKAFSAWCRSSPAYWSWFCHGLLLRRRRYREDCGSPFILRFRTCSAPEFNWQAILFIVPVALAPAIEHIGGVIAVGSVTGRDYLKKPGLHRTLLGDGIATTAAGLFKRLHPTPPTPR